MCILQDQHRDVEDRCVSVLRQFSTQRLKNWSESDRTLNVFDKLRKSFELRFLGSAFY